MSDLPIAALLDGMKAHLLKRPNALVIAPPGAGKSTLLPIHLLPEPWAQNGTIILLQPRRIAVRNVATQLARLSLKPLGQSVGYQMRGASKQSPETRLLVMTEGVFRRRLLADPELSGICAVLFDEYHERSLDADLCLALCREVQSSLRPDIRILVMSATLDETVMQAALPNFQVFKSKGRSYPIETLYRPTGPHSRLATDICAAVRHALASRDGNILCFLPGQRDIRFAQNALLNAFEGRQDIQICPLFGRQSDQAQQEALGPTQPNRRKIILATDIAETSLTVPGVHTVIDSGLRRAPVFDPRLGVTQLQRQRAGLDRLDQRRGRAGRLAPGLCIRLWAEQEMRAIAPTSKPDIDTQDLIDLVLACADWGLESIEDLPWTTAPPPGPISVAQDRLRGLGLLADDGRITSLGRLAAQLPLPADLAAMVLNASSSSIEREAALLAAVLSDGGGTSGPGRDDLQDDVRTLASGGGDAAIRKRASDILRVIAQSGVPLLQEEPSTNPGLLLAKVRPQLIAKARGGQQGGFKLAAGRGAFVVDASPLAAETYLVVGDAILDGDNVRIGSAWPITLQDVEVSLADLMTVRQQTIESVKSGRPQVETLTCLGDLIIKRTLDEMTAGPELAAILFEAIKERGFTSLPWPREFYAFSARAAFASKHGLDIPQLTDQSLYDTAEIWLLPELETVTSVGALSGPALFKAVMQLVPYDVVRRLAEFAPHSITAPAGIALDIDYAAKAGPTVAAKLQAFFGLKVHPTIAGGRVPLSISLLSPAGRPLQSTQDLPAFWAGSYDAVRRDMRGRYPKHPWPENPADAVPTLYTKARQKDEDR